MAAATKPDPELDFDDVAAEVDKAKEPKYPCSFAVSVAFLSTENQAKVANALKGDERTAEAIAVAIERLLASLGKKKPGHDNLVRRVREHRKLRCVICHG